MSRQERTVSLAAVGVFAASLACDFWSPAGGNPLGRDSSAVQAGDALFHAQCAICHGREAAGALASGLVRADSVTRGPADELFALMRNGIPGSEMPPQPDLSDEELWQIVAYLHHLARPRRLPPVAGDAEAGGRVFRSAGCAECHLVDGAGGFLGPPLDSIATRRTNGQLRNDVLDPDAELTRGYRTVIVDTKEGERVEGILKHESTFQVLLMTADGSVASFRRQDLQRVEESPQSAMPRDYGDRLTPEELQDLLAFLDRQREPQSVRVYRPFGVY